MANLEKESVSAVALRESISILELMENLLIGSDGRSYLAAMRFGGVTRLVRRLTFFLNHGSIHRDENGMECCAKFLRELHSQEISHLENIQSNESRAIGMQTLLHPDIYNTEDIQHWITNRILEATLYPALQLIASQSDNIHSATTISKNYEPHAFMRQSEAVHRLVEGSRPFDDQDSSRLAEIALFGSQVFKSPIPPDFILGEEIIENTNVPKFDDQRNTSDRTKKPKSYFPETLNDSAGTDKTYHGLSSLSMSDNNLKRSAEDAIASSCPGLTSVAFQRYLGERNWNSESLQDDDELEKLNIYQISKSLESLPCTSSRKLDIYQEHNIYDNCKFLMPGYLPKNLHDFNSRVTRKKHLKDKIVKSTGTRPKIKQPFKSKHSNKYLRQMSEQGNVEYSFENVENQRSNQLRNALELHDNEQSCKSNKLGTSKKPNLPAKQTEFNNKSYIEKSSLSMQNNKLKDGHVTTEINTDQRKIMKRSHRRTQSDTQAVKLNQKSEVHSTLSEIPAVPVPFTRRDSDKQDKAQFTMKDVEQIQSLNLDHTDSKPKTSQGDKCSPDPDQADYDTMNSASLLDYINSGTFSRHVNSGARQRNLGQRSHGLMADNAHLILAEALIQSGLSLLSDFRTGRGEEPDQNLVSNTDHIRTKNQTDLPGNENSDNNVNILITNATSSNSEENLLQRSDNKISTKEIATYERTKYSVEKNDPLDTVNMDYKLNFDENFQSSLPSGSYSSSETGFEDKKSEPYNGKTKETHSPSRLTYSSSIYDSSNDLTPNNDIISSHVGMSSSSPTFYTALPSEEGKGEANSCEIIEYSSTGMSSISNEDSSPRIFQKHSAEATALDLLYTLKDPHILKASDLALLIRNSQKILVSEEDAPQKLLPLPLEAGYIDDSQDNIGAIQRASDMSACGHFAKNIGRGIDDASFHLETSYIDNDPEKDVSSLNENPHWAPPTTQIILDFHQKPRKVKNALELQNYMCNDCGMKPSSASLAIKGGFRFCYYFGKYACTSCHSNQTHVLPSAIVTRWDFKEYPVSNFAHGVLSGLSQEPLFIVEELNPALLQKVSKLKKALELRKQACEIAKYLTSCRIAKEVIRKEYYKECIIKDPGNFTLIDLCLIRLGAYGKSLRHQVKVGMDHVFGKDGNSATSTDNSDNCPLCFARGFICEECRSEDVIFPFQPESEVYQCRICYACYHARCHLKLQKERGVDSISCYKCERIEKRRSQNAS